MTALEAMLKYYATHSPDTPDLTGWPADVSAIVQVVCELWNLKPPKTANGKAYWIASARELIDAASEYGEEAIRAVRYDFEAHMRSHGGGAPPGGGGGHRLVQAARGGGGGRPGG